MLNNGEERLHGERVGRWLAQLFFRDFGQGWRWCHLAKPVCEGRDQTRGGRSAAVGKREPAWLPTGIWAASSAPLSIPIAARKAAS